MGLVAARLESEDADEGMEPINCGSFARLTRAVRAEMNGAFFVLRRE